MPPPQRRTTGRGTMPPTDRRRPPTVTARGIVCPGCGAARFRTWQKAGAASPGPVRVDCAKCGATVRQLAPVGSADGPVYEARPNGLSAQALAPPAESSWWLGYVRPADNRWRPVVLA